MSRVPNTSKAEEFQVHSEGGPFAFRIASVDDFTSKNNDTGYPDKYKIHLDAIGPHQAGHCNMAIFPARSEHSYMLRMICEAVGLGSDGGYDSAELVGKTFQAEVGHNEWQEKIYANLKANTIAPYESDKDDDLPF